MRIMKNGAFAWICVLLFSLSMNLWGGGSSQPGKAETQKPAVYQRDPNLNAAGTFPINKTKVSLRIGVEQSRMVEDWETNWMTRQIEEKGNYDLSFEVYPSGELNQKLELMVLAGGGDLPDVLWCGVDIGTLTKYGQAGMIIPVNDYYKNSAYWINQSAKEINLDCLKYVTSYDGNIYGLYAIMVSLNNELSPARIMIYEPWLKKLGLEIPQTVDQYLDVLRAFRDRDPNGNGQKDEIPLAGQKANMNSNYIKTMMTPFIYTQDDFWILNNGKIDVAFNKPQWQEGIRFTKKLIDEGLLSPLSFTQDAPQLAAMVSPNPAKVGSFVGVSTSILGGNDTKRTEYTILPPLQGPGGRQQVLRPSLPSIRMIITKNCKTPESAFMLGDLMCGEELSVATRWGEKGVDWVVPEPGEKSVYDSIGYAAIIKPVTPWGPLQNKWYGQVGPFIVSAKWPVGQIPSGPYDHNIPIGRSIGPAIQFANRNPIVGLIYNEQEQEVINDHHATILTYVSESYARFVMGDLSVDTGWNSYVAEFDRMGLQDVIRVTQSAWDRMNK